MEKIIQLIILIGLVYGVVWISQNVDIENFVENTKKKMEESQTVQRVEKTRERTYNDAINVTK